MAKKKVTKAAPKPRKAVKKKLTFVTFFGNTQGLFAVDKNNDVYMWNGLDRAWVPNWDVDGSLKVRIAAANLQAKQEADKRNSAASNDPTPAANRLTRRAAASNAAPAQTESFE